MIGLMLIEIKELPRSKPGARGTRRMYEIKSKEFVESAKVWLNETVGRSYCKQVNIDEYVILTGDALCEMNVI